MARTATGRVAHVHSISHKRALLKHAGVVNQQTSLVSTDAILAGHPTTLKRPAMTGSAMAPFGDPMRAVLGGIC
jgi:hypothetical protein